MPAKETRYDKDRIKTIQDNYAVRKENLPGRSDDVLAPDVKGWGESTADWDIPEETDEKNP